MTWEQTCEKNITEILSLVETLANSCREGLENLPQLLIKFNFLFGTNQQIDYSQFLDLSETSQEEVKTLFHLPVYTPPSLPALQLHDSPWDFIEKQLLPMIEILIQGGEEAGSITTQGLLTIACHKVFNWILCVKSKLTSVEWGNIPR
jgi:hypothetical protein